MLSLHVINAVAVTLAWLCARYVPRYRTVAMALSAALAAELAGEALVAWVLPPPDPVRPVVGALRWAIYVDRALFIAWPTLLATCAIHLLAERRTWPVGVGYAIAVITLAVTYPATRFDLLRLCYLGIDIVALVIGFASLGRWILRYWGKRRADVSVTVPAVLIVGHFASVVAGPYKYGLFGPEWSLMQLAYLILFCIVILLQLGAIRESKQP